MKSQKSVFIGVFGDYPALRVIDFLMESRMFDYSITEIARNSNVHFVTFKKIWTRFQKQGFVTNTRKSGGKELYRINVENEVIKKLIEMDNFLSKKIAMEAQERHKKATIKQRASSSAAQGKPAVQLTA